MVTLLSSALSCYFNYTRQLGADDIFDTAGVNETVTSVLPTVEYRDCVSITYIYIIIYACNDPFGQVIRSLRVMSQLTCRLNMSF